LLTEDIHRQSRALSSAAPRFDVLYGEYADRIYRFSLRLTGGRAADAEDLAQEVFVAAYQGLDRFEGRAAVLTWLYRIAVFRWRRMRDRRGPEPLSLDAGNAPEPASTRDDPARAGLARLSLEAALATLPDALREAFLLVKAEGLKYREAADVLGVPQGTVQSRVHDATARLRAVLTDEPAATRGKVHR
jgi:RNA polymerase sigma-70 factor (ECF subfamily)